MAEGHVQGADAVSRIERMEQSGLISRAQAERLKAAVAVHSHTGPADVGVTRRHRVPIFFFSAALALVFILLIVLTGDDPKGVQDVAATLNEPGSVGAMNRILSISIAIFILVVVPVVVVAASYNGLVNKEEAVLTSWGQVESQFQRRADLIPALVETVTRYLKHERETLTEVTGQRQASLDRVAEAVNAVAAGQQALASTRSEDDSLLEDQEALNRLFAESAAVEKEIRGLFAVAEDYPALASSDQFLELQAQLEGTENRINVARLRFNEAVGEFNSAIRRIPGNLAAGLGGFTRKAYFRAEEGSDEAQESLFE